MIKKYFISILIIFSLCLTVFAKSKDSGKNVTEDGEKKNYIGWVDASSKEISYKKGMIQFRVKPNLGSFNISVTNNKEKMIPVLSTVDEFTSTLFYLKTPKKIYKLQTENNIRTGVAKTENGLTITYSVPNVADVAVGFECFQSSIEHDFDTVKTTVTITNKGNKKDEFAVKQIIDTVLGESSAQHFYTSDDSAIKNEVLYRDLKGQKWFTSKNNYAAMQLVFKGADATEPEMVALANYSTLAKSSWEPDMLSFRTFDTVLSYNNSAVGVIWPSVKILPKESKKIVYYTFFATDGETPNGEEYIFGKAEPEKKEEIPEIEPVVVPSPEPAPVKENKPRPPVKEEVYTPKNIPTMEFNVENFSKNQFTPEYIQNLLDRIAVLEKNSSSVNREELLRLNAELDAILSALRQ